jgi:hypothetical protein
MIAVGVKNTHRSGLRIPVVDLALPIGDRSLGTDDEDAGMACLTSRDDRAGGLT